MSQTKEMLMFKIDIVSTGFHVHWPTWIHDAAHGLRLETASLCKALVSPSGICGAVERIAALHEEARRIEASEPLRASQLRQQAAQVKV
jgi:hypothetical protein